MPTHEDKDGPIKLSATSKQSSCLASSSTVAINAAPVGKSTSSEMTKDSCQKLPVEQAKDEPRQLSRSNTGTAVPAHQQMVPMFLNLASNKTRLSKQNALTVPLKHSDQSKAFYRLLSQMNKKAFSGFGSNESQFKQLIKVTSNILDSSKLPNWNKSKDQLENAFTAEQYKLLKLIVDSVLSSTFDQSIEDTKELIIKMVTCFPTTIGPIVYQKLCDALPKLVEQVTCVLESMLESAKSHKQKSSDSEKDVTKQIEADLTVIKDRYSNENIVVNGGRSAPLNESSGRHYRQPLNRDKLSSQLTLLNTVKFCEQIRKLLQMDAKLQNDYRQLPQLNQLWDTLNKYLELLGQASPGELVCIQSVIETFLLVQAPPPKPQPDVESLAQQLAHIKQCVTRLPAESNESSAKQETNLDKMAKSIAPQFFNFVTTNRPALNQILREHSGKPHWASGPFGILGEYSQLLDFDVKRVFFRHQLSRYLVSREFTLRIKRANLLEDSFRQLAFLPVIGWKRLFSVDFTDEGGDDAGGLLREWFLIVSRDMFNQNYGLFTQVGDQDIYTINSSSHCNSNHLAYFKFFGRLIGKAILESQLVECYFTRSMYKHMLGKAIVYTDMEQEDNEYYKGLLFLLQHKLAEIPGGTDMRFVHETQVLGVPKTIELVSDGQNVHVTDENKHHYVKLVCLEKMIGSIRAQLMAFLEGFYSLVPKRYISIFNEHELELLISGLPSIDLDELRNKVVYYGFRKDEPQIQWLWTALKSFDQTDRAKFLQFVTGTSKVSLARFGRSITISRDDEAAGRYDRLPTAHTCSMQLVLPVYDSYERQRLMILKAIQECSEGFAFS